MEQFRLTGVGPVLIPARRRLFSYAEETLIALSGPGASLLLALTAGALARRFAPPGVCLLTGLSLALGIFNLLPACPLDGGRVLRSVVSCLAGPDRGERTCLWITRALALLITVAGLLIWRANGNFTLLLCGVWLASGAMTQQKT